MKTQWERDLFEESCAVGAFRELLRSERFWISAFLRSLTGNPFALRQRIPNLRSYAEELVKEHSALLPKRNLMDQFASSSRLWEIYSVWDREVNSKIAEGVFYAAKKLNAPKGADHDEIIENTRLAVTERFRMIEIKIDQLLVQLDQHAESLFWSQKVFRELLISFLIEIQQATSISHESAEALGREIEVLRADKPLGPKFWEGLKPILQGAGGSAVFETGKMLGEKLLHLIVGE